MICLGCSGSYGVRSDGYCDCCYRRIHAGFNRRPFPAEWAASHHESIASAVGTGRPSLLARVSDAVVVGGLRAVAWVARRLAR